MAATRKVALTDRGLKALKAAPAGKRYFVWDAIQPHLGVRVTDRGHKSFLVVRRRPGDPQPIYHVIGSYPSVSLGDARQATPDVLGAIEKGVHPREIERERLREEARRRRDTFGVVAEEFIKRHVSHLRSARATEALIRRELLGQRLVSGEWISDQTRATHWRERPVTDIARRDVIEIVEAIIDRGTRHQARKVFAAVQKLFNWAIHRDTYGLDQSPCTRIKAADLVGVTGARTRVLNDEELRFVWQAAEKIAYPFGSLVQVLLLTGQRLREISDARWDEINLDDATLTVPAARMKGKVGHSVPLTPAVVSILKPVPRFEGGVFVFSTTAGQRPVSGFSKAKTSVDRAIANALAETRQKPTDKPDELPAWTIHDLRRTVRTRLSSLSVLPLVAELVIGHKQAGIHAVYDLHRYDAEKREALLRWENSFLEIIEPEPENNAPQSDDTASPKVVPIGGRQQR